MKPKQIMIYISVMVAVLLPFFFATLIVQEVLDLPANSFRGSIGSMVIGFISIPVYGVYIIIHLISNKVLPTYIYKENKTIKILTFFLITLFGWTLLLGIGSFWALALY